MKDERERGANEKANAACRRHTHVCSVSCVFEVAASRKRNGGGGTYGRWGQGSPKQHLVMSLPPLNSPLRNYFYRCCLFVERVAVFRCAGVFLLKGSAAKLALSCPFCPLFDKLSSYLNIPLGMPWPFGRRVGSFNDEAPDLVEVGGLEDLCQNPWYKSIRVNTWAYGAKYNMLQGYAQIVAALSHPLTVFLVPAVKVVDSSSPLKEIKQMLETETGQDLDQLNGMFYKIEKGQAVFIPAGMLTVIFHFAPHKSDIKLVHALVMPFPKEVPSPSDLPVEVWNSIKAMNREWLIRQRNCRHWGPVSELFPA